VSALTSSNAFSYTTGGITVGNRYDFTAAFPGHICEFIIYSVSLTTLQRQEVEGYLAQKWGLGASFVGGVTRPTQIPGCVLWLDGADSTSITLSGSSVTQWNDKSGNAGNATQGSSGNRPTFTGSGVIFNASSSQYLNLNTTYASTHSVYIVATSTSASQVYLFGRNYSTSAPAIIMNFVGSSIEYYGGNDGTTRSTFVTTPTSTFVAGYIRTYNSSVVGRYNGSQVFNVGGPTSEPSSMNWGYLGDSDGSHSNFYTGTIYEFLIFNTALTTIQATQIEQYLARKWGLGASLLLESGIHPFSQYPPFTRPFQPIDLSNCVLWLDAADSSSITTSGSTVTTWVDKATGLSFTGSAQLSTSGTYNGLNTISFRRTSNMYLYNSSFTYKLADRTTFWVWRSVSDGGNSGILSFSSPGGVDYNSLNALIIAVGAPTATWGPAYVDANGVFSGYSPTYTAQTSLGMFSETNVNNTETLFINGTPNVIYSVGGSYVGYSQAQSSMLDSIGLIIGARYQSGDANISGYSSIDLCEVICFSPSLTTSQKLQVEGYLARKWGLASSLPTTHPFYNFSSSTVVGFLPTQIYGCSLWLDAADSSTIGLSGTTVTQWNDKSGRAINLTSYSGTTSYSSGKYVQLNGSIMSSSSSEIDLTNVTLFMVASSPNSYYNQPAFSGLPASGQANYSSTSGFGFYLDGDRNGYRMYGQYFSGVVSTATGISFLQNPTVIVGSLASAGAMAVYLNGSLSSTATMSSRTKPAYGFTIGGEGYIGSLNTYSSSCRFYEIIVYNSLLSSVQRQQVEGYLAQKWGLSTSLPTNHPYAKIPLAMTIRGTAPVRLANFSYTGSSQYWVVPAGVNSIFITLTGAGGGGGYGSSGGSGGLVSGTLAVSPGTTYVIIVGGAGTSGRTHAYGGGGQGGYYGYGGAGGGRTALADNVGNDIVTAGAGGGGAYYATGGAGGGNDGGNGNGSGGGGQYSGGYPSTSYGAFYYDGTYGGQYYGGDGGYYYGGGGGSGWYGGGGGGYYTQTGAGGSSYVGNLTGTVVNTQGGGASSGNNGSVSISY
jgi:hypothetical protein